MKNLIRSMAIGGIAIMATVGTGGIASASPATIVKNGGPYYLALGDSLSVGYQPNAQGIGEETDQGYVDDIYSNQLQTTPSLKVVKLGCPGETTTTFLKGGICPQYPSQQAAADRFLKDYNSQISFVTLDIGANDVDNCASAAGIDFKCLVKGEKTAQKNLPIILQRLQAADPGVPIYAMNYYDPFLADYLLGTQNSEALALASVNLTVGYNNALDNIYSQYGVKVADVQDTPFSTQDETFTDGFTNPSNGQAIPNDVGILCGLTYNCTPAPVGPNIHPNPTGYQGIANEFLSVINPGG